MLLPYGIVDACDPVDVEGPAKGGRSTPKDAPGKPRFKGSCPVGTFPQLVRFREWAPWVVLSDAASAGDGPLLLRPVEVLVKSTADEAEVGGESCWLASSFGNLSIRGARRMTSRTAP